MIEPGAVLGRRYRILRKISKGGMGAVYEAHNLALGRAVAVKILHEEHASCAELIERFEREIRASGSVEHPNVVRVVDYGRHGRLPYLVMEHLQGETLARRIAARPVPIGSAVGILRQVLDALGAVHRVGVVHRDLKPDNIFLVRDGDTADFVKLIDFGISKVRGPAAPTSMTLTLEGMVIGTVSYMAPEQGLASRDVDQRADIYSAGVILYEMLTGSLPYDLACTAAVLVGKRPEFGPPKPFAVSLPEGLEAATRRALSVEPSARFQTAKQFAQAIEPFATYETDSEMVYIPRAGDTPVHTAVTRVASFSESGQRPDDVTHADPSAPARASGQ